ncbi:MAG: DUF3261 domain-containing protein [Bacteroides sp.]|nr:DUF3261 domain-containing protein [Prevotella sp.]MCM1408021.1 DUF3261 domain-containing protein [Treponema brennaborense]MCM1468997.1 DUF3261 domain-containing protein [Bacteroides sp.]
MNVKHAAAFLGAGILLLFAASCGATGKNIAETYPAAEKSVSVRLSGKSVYTLLPVRCMEGSIDGVQHISASFGNKSFSADAFVQSDAEKLFIIVFNNFGSTMAEIEYAGNAVSLYSAMLPDFIKPEYIIADFQFCFYEVSSVSAALCKSGLTLKTAHENETEIRRIYNGKKLIIEIKKSGAFAEYSNYARGYFYKLNGDYPK